MTSAFFAAVLFSSGANAQCQDLVGKNLCENADSCCYSLSTFEGRTCITLEAVQKTALETAYSSWNFVGGSPCKNETTGESMQCDTTVNGIECPDNTPPITCDDAGNVLDILLGNDGLSGNLADGIGDASTGLAKMTRLETLSLAANTLSGEVPASLGFLTGLKGLFLYNNQLRGSFPDLTALTSLEWAPAMADTQCRLTLSSNEGSGANSWMFFGPGTNCFDSGCDGSKLPTACLETDINGNDGGAKNTGYATKCHWHSGAADSGTCPDPDLSGAGTVTPVATPAPVSCQAVPTTAGLCNFPAGHQIDASRADGCTRAHSTGSALATGGECMMALMQEPECAAALNAQLCSSSCAACTESTFTKLCPNVCTNILDKCSQSLSSCPVGDVNSLCSTENSECKSLVPAVAPPPPPPPPCVPGTMGCPCDNSMCAQGLQCDATLSCIMAVETDGAASLSLSAALAVGVASAT
eukprot:CAMPEP_0170753376 /NCGR_PEP_ID=MMETSP0437-20130122/12461_1 /TAXON_ID=0 /ORGANISM="Sexangularia sp." /LENGTH=469 /DNA_ID=CAMNT_0011092493 /DNA_START=87 /DNA_END=1492 /DNA_ORIENTATION=+